MDIQNRIIELLQATNRQGIEQLISHICINSDFFTAPCSTQYHLSKQGGLAEHSLNVFKFANDIYGTILPDFSHEEMVIATLLHDIGKSNYREKPFYVPNILKGGKVSETKPYETNKDRLFISHEIISLQILSRFMELTEEEEFAILYHNGLYVASGKDIQGKERPLQQLLHFSDMWSSRFIEVGDQE
jgi:23S rRNA maturation-related 3'-5' exoribonuclease YhaM